MRWSVILLLSVVQVLEEVEKGQVATFIPDTDLRAFFVLVASYDVTFEEVVPAVTSLKCARIKELNLLLFYREKEVLSRLDKNHVYIVV